ncbi:thioredoxin domain-containing protein [Roseomonas fluvialis]|uniref:DSBA oxidoreductase n=1 Tax=Roseomonas fluvialis TaxID=1750527 RepID=A0ABM7Y6R9_9PROT|nr:thioredoxin domain-containing protein [Roseomonas fluvialis]BDG73695.1 DSBA oxidoreductase [Roseomonas fluvialis]
MFDRRTILAAGGSLMAGRAVAQTAAPAPSDAPIPAPAVDQRLTERSIGSADAPMVVQEFFSLTCSHCGAFHRETYPRVKAELIDTGKIRLVWRDFPLDQVALGAAVVARSFPPDRYEAFLTALFATQDRWAYARGVDHKAEIGKIAAVAGMSGAAFEAAWTDVDLARAILVERQKGEQEYRIQATPTFVFNRRVVGGNIPFDRFAREAATP